MKLELLTQVTKLERLERYPLKPGTTDTDYGKPKEPYTRSTLEVLPNAQGVSGELRLETELRFGQLVRITVDTAAESARGLSVVSIADGEEDVRPATQAEVEGLAAERTAAVEG